MAPSRHRSAREVSSGIQTQVAGVAKKVLQKGYAPERTLRSVIRGERGSALPAVAGANAYAAARSSQQRCMVEQTVRQSPVFPRGAGSAG